MARWLYKLGTVSARHRWWVVGVWIVALAAVGALAATGMKFADGNFDIPGTDSSRALSTIEKEFGAEASSAPKSLQVVMQSTDGSRLDDSAGRSSVDAVVGAVADVDGVAGVSNPLDPATVYVSENGTTAVATVSVDANLANPEATQAAVLDAAATAGTDGIQVEVGGTLADEFPQILSITEVVGAAIAFLVLLITFGSLLAAGANMLGALLGVGVGVLGVLAASAWSPIQSTTPILAVMLGLAVGIDYGLFVLARFRSELREGRAITEAIGFATGTAGSAVVFAGTTVFIALAGLSVVGIPFITEMGLAAAAAVLIAILMALTLMPALLGFAGRKALPRPEREGTEAVPVPSEETVRRGFLERWIGVVVKRPLTSALCAAGALVIVVVPVLSLDTTLNVPGGDDPEGTSRAAYTIIADEFGAGIQDPLLLLVQGDNLTNSTGAVEQMLGDIDGIVSVAPAQLSPAGTAATIAVIPETGPLADETESLVREIRAQSQSLPDGVTVSVTGQTAIGIDTDQTLADALIVYIALIAGLSLVLLIIVFRSLVVPVVATLGFLLTLGAAIGATVAVFQWGWLDAVIVAPQGDPLLSILPIVVTGILFGLAMDYQVFLVSRMHEAYRKGVPATEAILDGFGRTAGVVVAAASIMTAVFAGFALSHSAFVASIAFALTIGVLVDAFVVRMIIVPALLRLCGDAAWWIPSWLDKILPHIDAEGTTLEDTENSPIEALPASESSTG